MSLLILAVDDEPDVEILFRQQFRRDLRGGRFTMLFAQSAPADQSNPMSTWLRGAYTRNRGTIVRTAEKMPEENYAMRPGSQQEVRTFGQQLTHPVGALPLFVLSTWLWHVPRVYEAALRSSTLHYVQHACFLAAALVFWYPVVRPDPARPRWSRWLMKTPAG